MKSARHAQYAYKEGNHTAYGMYQYGGQRDEEGRYAAQKHIKWHGAALWWRGSAHGERASVAAARLYGGRQQRVTRGARQRRVRAVRYGGAAIRRRPRYKQRQQC